MRAGDSYPYLLADVGGTNTRFAFLRRDNTLASLAVFANTAFPSLEALASAYLESQAALDPPRAGVFAVAGPVTGGVARLTNLGWAFSAAELKDRLHLNTLAVINDFTLCWGYALIFGSKGIDAHGAAVIPEGDSRLTTAEAISSSESGEMPIGIYFA